MHQRPLGPPLLSPWGFQSLKSTSKYPWWENTFKFERFENQVCVWFHRWAGFHVNVKSNRKNRANKNSTTGRWILLPTNFVCLALMTVTTIAALGGRKRFFYQTHAALHVVQTTVSVFCSIRFFVFFATLLLFFVSPFPFILPLGGKGSKNLFVRQVWPFDFFFLLWLFRVGIYAWITCQIQRPWRSSSGCIIWICIEIENQSAEGMPHRRCSPLATFENFKLVKWRRGPQTLVVH